ncbi:uncharacterized protein LOC124817534 [Hydra vulgaris]|uniref:uncharacterized protein LOC124817534 n=1 Tax=Hydra vulgaris TaxID=6087 RepID=UPI001F5E5D19|nr:uncharacterized protein LOC124817534 [Hydra vulgaris]
MKLFILACLISILTAEKEIKSKKENCSNEWVLLQKNTCFEAKGDNPAIIPVKIKGWLSEIKLVHVSGVLKCWQHSSGSKFGCYDGGNDLYVFITDNKRKVIFPSTNQPLTYGPRDYKLPGVTANDNEVIFSKLEYPVPYRREEQYIKVWNGEDLFGFTEHDNSGKVCVDAYGMFL